MNNVRTPSLEIVNPRRFKSSAVKIVQDCKSRERTAFALSSSLSVLKFNIHKDSAKGAEGIWNVKCTGTALEAFEQVCSLRMTPGSIGVTDFVVYDFDAKKLVWRSYETIESLRSKISKVFEVLGKIRPSPLGWALYDVDFEDYKGSCSKDFSRSQLDTSRIRWLKDFLLNSSSAPHATKKRR
ncbi:uncharacterized protein LOC135399706 [Ornithodoros turicata]|uniref:uncharacterized protein LOC135399706 n=1 Tax=Ornithodoros turicata TaxID=34597 RepID=UPI00313903FE